MRLLRALTFSASLAVAALRLTQAADLALEQEIDGLIDSSPDLSRGHIGYEFADADTGEVLAQRGPTQYFTPASNTKLYTTALALVRLGIAYQFKTVVRTHATQIDVSGSVPDVVFIAGGDPNLSGRTLPYSIEPVQSDPLSAVAALANQIAGKGITRVNGDLTADDTRYPYEPYPDGWTIDDATWSYGAPVSAFSINDNSVHLRVQPTKPGELAGIVLEPEVGALVLLNEAVTVPGTESKLSVQRIPGSSELIVSGTIGAGAKEAQEDVAVPDAALFAAQCLAYELENRGIAVRGQVRALHVNAAAFNDVLSIPRTVTAPDGTELASIISPPLPEAVQIVNKVSQNLHAEMLLREVAFATRNVGTLAAGLDEEKIFLKEAGIAETDYSFDDGSGLARQGLTTPSNTVFLLRYMWHRPERQAWFDSLPTAGLDGSLKRRFHDVPGADRVHAKTGSFAHVAALSGYLQTKGGRWVAFSLMANAEVTDPANVQRFFDAACGVFLNMQ